MSGGKAAVLDPDLRAKAYLRFLVEIGGLRRWGKGWKTPERVDRLNMELGVIEKAGFSPAFVMLAGILDHCRKVKIPYGPGRGSVGGSLVAYAIGIHEADSLEWDLYFERFLNPERVSFPDVDLDFSQRHRTKVLDFITENYQRDGQVVMQVAAFQRSGAKSTVDMVANAMYDTLGGEAYEIAMSLKKCLPEGNITGGKKIPRELTWWLENGNGDKKRFKALAEAHGWMDPLLKLDGIFLNLAKHAAGVVILRAEDLRFIPRTSSDGEHMSTGYDMHDLDNLGYLKWDILGLRTLDVIADADRMSGGDGSMDRLMQIWRDHRDDEDVYQIFKEQDTVGIFQMETNGYQRTLKAFQPDCFDHIVQLVALYRPGAIDYVRESDGKNMVDVFIARRHGKESVTYLHPSVAKVLEETHGVLLYQEQQMAMVRAMAGFTMAEADRLRRAIGKKKQKEMEALQPLWVSGCKKNGIDDAIAAAGWENISAAARYSWNKAHAVEYGIVTWLTAWFKFHHPAAFYAAEVNSHVKDKDRQAGVISEARQRVELGAPDINAAEAMFSADGDTLVFGLNGIKGMGAANRDAILLERLFGRFQSYRDFCERLPSVPSNMKKALIACGAFDTIERKWTRDELLSQVQKGKGDKTWTVAEHLNHNVKLKNPREVPEIEETPTEEDMAQAELDATGYYIARSPMRDVEKALTRLPPGHIGGKVKSRKDKIDKNDNLMQFVWLTTPDLQTVKLTIFASKWEGLQHLPIWEVGAKLIARGRMDGKSYLVDRAWAPDDVRHFKKIQITSPEGEVTTEPFDGKSTTVDTLLEFGYKVRFL